MSKATQNPRTCQHLETEIRRCMKRNGTYAVYRQCLACGIKASSQMPFLAALKETGKVRIADLPAFDTELEQSGADWAGQSWIEATRPSQEESWNKYNEYLRSESWRRRSRMCLERDGYKCQAQYEGCLGRATQSHHLTYRHIYNEPLFDLISVCQSCHEKITEMERSSRGVAI